MHEVEVVVLEEQPALIVKGTVPVDQIAAFLGRAFRDVMARLAKVGASPVGPPFARYEVMMGAFSVEAGFPVGPGVTGDGDVELITLPRGEAAVTWHIGPYDTMTTAYAALSSWLSHHSAETAGAAWEIYYSDPQDIPDPAKWRTEIVQPYRVLVRH